MRFAILFCTLMIALLLTGNTAGAEKCYVELNGGVGEWKGPCKDGKSYGSGVAEFLNFTYEGPAKDGRAHGEAGLRFDNGANVRGNFDHGAPQGRFEGMDADGDRINGEFRLGADGRRRLTYMGSDPQDEQTPPAQGAASAREEPLARKCYLDNGRESLEWSGPCGEDGRAEGNGTATDPDGVTYTGSAKGGTPHGRGSIRDANGRLLYEGGYRNGFPHGRGTVLDEDGKYYVSNFDMGDPVGEMTPVDGAAPDESRPETVSDTDAGAGEGAPPGVDGESDPNEDANYDAALKALDGDGRAVRSETPGDSYGAKLQELDDSEKRARLKEAQDYLRKIELEKQRRSEALKAELRKKADAIEAKKIEKWNKLYKPHKNVNPDRSPAPVETQRTNWHSLADTLRQSMEKLDKRVKEINRRRERQRQQYLREVREERRRREAERRRKTRIPLPMGGYSDDCPPPGPVC
ncbi:MAG: hypothetical protein OXL41_08565 [Nitrospinae bacterium]|nr:hypothetical protein [Nitrospinota bacterium]